VPITTGDRLCWRWHYQTPNYIKIDTDGNEYDILCGMASILSDNLLKSVLVEINNNQDEIMGFMSRFGFDPDKKYNDLKDRPTDNNVIFKRRG